ncbi:hypothetical protein AVEN_162548-1, partial [Araneus ventricosus]
MKLKCCVPHIDDDYDLDTWDPKEIIEVLWDNCTPYPANILKFEGYTPNLLHFCRNLPLIFDTYNNNSEPLFVEKAHYLQDLLQQLNTAYELAHSSLKRKQVEQNNTLAKNSRPTTLHVGDVYLKSKGSFMTRIERPYTIIATKGEVNHTIEALDNKFARSFTVHVDRL